MSDCWTIVRGLGISRSTAAGGFNFTALRLAMEDLVASLATNIPKAGIPGPPGGPRTKLAHRAGGPVFGRKQDYEKVVGLC